MSGHTESGLGDNTTHARPVNSDMGVAVIAVWNNRGREYSTCRSCWSAMEDYARLLSSRTALRTSVIPLAQGYPYPVATRIQELSTQTAAAFLIGLDATDSAAVQSIVAAHGGRLVVSETDVLTAAAAAAAVTALRGKGIPPKHGRLAILGADRTPRLGAVLLECGAGTVTSPTGHHFEGPEIRSLMVDHDIVVNLTGQESMWMVPARTVSIPTDPFALGALAVPGLLSALCGHGTTHVGIEILAAAACALALITPVDRTLPEIADHRLVHAVAQHVGRVVASA